MTITFGTNRFGFPDPQRLIESCRQAEAAGFTRFWFPDSQLRTGDVFINLLTAAQHTSSVSPWARCW
jgi:alkanesulfonate monooxygenase SsuD/methylene tetrahydromethanopterin reductase-like flavin-dependent oxidoreductase (luciferase family)